jgi:hypothetical protein
MKHEYQEGPKAGENFEQLARAVFQKPKVEVPKKQPKATPKRRVPQVPFVGPGIARIFIRAID